MSPEEKAQRKLFALLTGRREGKSSQPGDLVTLRSGVQYRIGPRGNWIKLSNAQRPIDEVQP